MLDKAPARWERADVPDVGRTRSDVGVHASEQTSRDLPGDIGAR